MSEFISEMSNIYSGGAHEDASLDPTHTISDFTLGSASVSILDSRFWGDTYLGDKFYAFFNVFFCILGDFLGGFGIGGGGDPPGDSWK